MRSKKAISKKYTDFLPTLESTYGISMNRGFCAIDSPYVLVDQELIEFARTKDGMRLVRRGCAGTTPAAHAKGSVIKHIEGRYHGLVPVFGSDLFYEVARRTARAFNEGGFRMIYLDALAVTYDYSNVFNGIDRAALHRYAGLRRNIALYKNYDALRRAQVFSEEYRARLAASPYEKKLIEKCGGKYAFVEKKYEVAKLYDLGDEKPVWFKADIKAPRGKFKATLTARALNRCTPRAQLTLGFTGKEIK